VGGRNCFTPILFNGRARALCESRDQYERPADVGCEALHLVVRVPADAVVAAVCMCSAAGAVNGLRSAESAVS
jgi:hypothetical protein